jgi:hypothetical protein
MIAKLGVAIIDRFADYLKEEHEARVGAALQRGADAREAQQKAAEMRQIESAGDAKSDAEIRADLARRSGLAPPPGSVQPQSGEPDGKR